MKQDAELPVPAARRGDPDAWDVLFRRYQLPLYTYAVDLLRDEHLALDVVQETFLKAFRHLDSLRDDARFGSWLFGIAHQNIVSHWRRLGRSPFSDDPVPESESSADPEPGFDLIRVEEREAVLAAVDALPSAQRVVILLHFLEDFPLAEIAAITGTFVGTVKSRLHYGKAALRQRLSTIVPRP
ncbi:MAG: sigma-70 family RNA polymerase sigma factor [Verrucomicrobiales bacterium]|nr:sigma-70 family RNA polymerase sigma factor [Verrucomicrobiales bacterium]